MKKSKTYLICRYMSVFGESFVIGMHKHWKLENVYLGDHGRSKVYKNALYYLCDYSPSLFKVQNPYSNRTGFIEWYPIEEENKIMVVVQVHPNYKVDLNYFKRGLYSRIKKTYVAKHFSEYIYDNSGEELLSEAFGVFHKKEWLREEYLKKEIDIPKGQELWDIPYAQEEIYRFQKSKATDLSIKNK